MNNSDKNDHARKSPGTDCIVRLRLIIYGAVQGVGFRPFIYRLARELNLSGWVNNSPQGVGIEVEGPRAKVEVFLLRCEREKPVNAIIQSLESAFLDPAGYTRFEISQSEISGLKTALILPDIATCPDCRREIFDSHDRRYLYPFTNCTNCGPRFTIIQALPYDRPNTSMKQFAMCDACLREYNDPDDRRFHAQPNACPECGPQLKLCDPGGETLAEGHEALQQTAEALGQSRIAAVKGLGGFHLMVDARNDQAVGLLRERKHREEKPFALMFPALESVRQYCEVSEREARLLQSPEAPIVLLQRRTGARADIAASVAPNNPCLGVMLPYTPLHHLLMRQLGFPVIATSGNLADEPICTDESEALARLAGIADLFLVHNRPIVRHADDSIVRMMGDRELVLRRARGYAPLPIRLQESAPPLLAVGAHLKNNVAISAGQDVFVSQHIGDLETVEAYTAFEQVIEDFQRLYEISPGTIVCDLHPDYLSTQYAGRRQTPVTAIQHHLAHVLSCMAENELEGPVLGVAWDGTGLGVDHSIWGGEFLRVTGSAWERVAHFRPFRLPGGDQAVREPRRAALGVLYEIYGAELFAMNDLPPVSSFSPRELTAVHKMIDQRINTVSTSSAGRLFDAVAAIAGLRQVNRYEGQAAMELEFSIGPISTDEAYSVSLAKAGEPPGSQTLWVDWEPMLREILEDVRQEVPIGQIAAKFHNALVEAIILVAAEIGEEKVVMTGGCFQNKYLTERAIHRLSHAGFRPYTHQRIPPNDGGISLGQLAAAARGLS